MKHSGLFFLIFPLFHFKEDEVRTSTGKPYLCIVVIASLCKVQPGFVIPFQLRTLLSIAIRLRIALRSPPPADARRKFFTERQVVVPLHSAESQPDAQDLLDLSRSGCRDMTGLAGSSWLMWRDILTMNPTQIAASLNMTIKS
jgi:hypothetical protein